MYGLPDSAILGTAKRVGRMGKLEKKREYQTTENLFDWLVRKLDNLFPTPAPKELAEERKAFYEEHGYYPPAVR